jgi:hypothetical protein
LHKQGALLELAQLGHRASEHLAGEVDAHDARSGSREIAGQIARAATGIDHQLPAYRAGSPHGLPPPAPIDAERQRAVQQVVAPGDAGEHRAHLVGRRHVGRTCGGARA